MAGLYLGLTKMAVDGTLSLVKSTVEEEKKLRENVQKDLVFITGEFEVMRSFLRIASAEHEVELTRMRQLRNLAFDVEDCVEYVVHLDLDKSSFLVWLQRFWQTVNFCRKPWLPLDVAVAEIKQLRARVEDVSQRNTRYSNLIRNSSNIQQAVPPDSALPPSPPLFPMLRDAWETSGKWSHSMCNLKEMIILREGDDDLHVISVWASTGGGGDDLGMASIFRQAYCDPEICQKFKRCAWVKLTHPFNHHEFVKSLMAQFCVTSHQPNAEFTELNLMRAKKALRKQMRRHKYLLILEDVLTVAEWDIIRAYLPDNKKGSRIIMSTTELGIARFCTGEPYQVSELRHFSDGQFLCAFFKKMQSTMDYLKSQLRCHGVVISVWGFFDNRYYKAYLIDILYKGIINQLKEFGGIKFGRHSWVDVPDEFDLEVFAQRLFLNFYSDNDFRAREIRKVGKKGLQGIIERCRRFLFEEDCLVIIYGVRSKNVWNKIKRTFLLSSSEPSSRTTKGCILVVTDEQDVARYCIKNQEYQTPLNVKDLDADTAVATLRNKGTWYCGLGGNKKGRLFYDRPKDDASEWHGKFGNHSNYAFSLLQGQSGLITVSGNTADIGLQVLLRSAYYCAARRSWVDVSPSESDFDLTDFLWRLLLDFCSDDPYDPQRKEAVAVTLMRGNINIDPIAKCRREFLQVESAQHLVVVIHGVHSTEHWDLIRAKLLSQGFHGTIIVSATDNSLLT